MWDAKIHMWYHQHHCHPLPWVSGGALESKARGCRAAASGPSTSPTPSQGCLQHPPCPAQHSGPCPESSSVPDPVRLGQSGGSSPHRLALLCVSSQADYCPQANILIEGSRQARAPGSPSSLSCHLPQTGGFGAQQRFWGLRKMLGGGHGSGPWWSSRTPWDLGTQEKGLFHCPWMLCSLHPSLACRGPAPSLSFFFKTERTHTKKPITQPSAPKRGRKSLKRVWALGRNAA